MLVTNRPKFSAEEVWQSVLSHFGRDVVNISELPGERDQNFLLTAGLDEKFVLKISNPEEDPQILDLQSQALRHLAGSSVSELVPKLIAARDGSDMVLVERSDQGFWMRLVSYLEGVPLGVAEPVTRELMVEAGRLLGGLDESLLCFEHPAACRHLYWDSKHAVETIRNNLPLLQPDERELINAFLAKTERPVSELVSRVRQSTIHNDPNDYNLIVDRQCDPTEFRGIIDFGDIVSTYTVCELANACSYLMMRAEDPWEAVSEATSGYEEVLPLTVDERRLLPSMIVLRLCLSVSNAARQKRDDPENKYLVISEKPAWRLLALLSNDEDELGF